MTPIFRMRKGCYDKPWRCPGWAGSGWRYAYDHEVTCRSGHGHLNTAVRAWKWRPIYCNSCGMRVAPYMLRWLDPSFVRVILDLRIRRRFDR